MKTYLIVNADDFGRTLEINDGIVHAFQYGVVSSTTIMANFSASDDAVAKALKHGIPVGLHFNLTDGRPVSRPEDVPSLVDSNGHFYRKFRFYRRLLARRFRAQDIRRELKAQLLKCLESGLALDHYDGHHHVHALRGIASITQSLFSEYKELPFRRISWPHWSQNGASKAQQVAIHLLEDRMLNHRCTATKFWGFDFMDRGDKMAAFIKMLEKMQPGFHEMMCHPGYKSDEFIGYYNEQREREVAVLSDEKLKAKIKDMDIQLVSYRELSGAIKR
jgi:predicted glycoside hydrolase/deacetylase ChbG (UPF0249 family)